ncbi:MAG: hypothetical protein WCV84_04555 [Patescibacteria group bacterium]
MPEQLEINAGRIVEEPIRKLLRKINQAVELAAEIWPEPPQAAGMPDPWTMNLSEIVNARITLKRYQPRKQ